MKRSEMGYSQNTLGNMVGVTFQQIQKYEKGTNRIGSGRLYEFAKILKVPVSYFYEQCEEVVEGISEVVSSCGESILKENDISEREIVALIKNYSQVKDKKVRKLICDLARRITRDVKEVKEEDEEVKDEDNEEVKDEDEKNEEEDEEMKDKDNDNEENNEEDKENEVSGYYYS